jgi:CRP-like cAMP-binding protein
MKTLLPNFVVGIAGSAGALTAYKAFFEKLPATTGMAFVVIFHMNPAANNQLASVLSRHTKMPVIVPSTGMPIRKNHVYVIPPNADLRIDSDTFKVISPCTNKGNAIDCFLVSLAEALGPRAIAIILSGHGHDGTEGCKLIKAMGGTTFTQDRSAEVAGMAVSAQASGSVDFVLPADKIPAALQRLVRSAKPGGPEAGAFDTSAPQQNHLIAAFPAAVKRRLLPELELVALPIGKVLYDSGEILRDVYFPTTSLISLLYVMGDGQSSELAVVGNDGLIGVALFMGGESTSSRAVVQIAGYAYRLSGQRLKEEFNLHGTMMLSLLLYTQALITQMTQTAACNLHHSIDQRLCRCLLLRLDRLPSAKVIMTQEMLSYILGVRREGVTEAAGRLLKLGVIEYVRGQITVLDRPKLEKLSCECYAVVKKESNRLVAIRPSVRSRVAA